MVRGCRPGVLGTKAEDNLGLRSARNDGSDSSSFRAGRWIPSPTNGKRDSVGSEEYIEEHGDAKVPQSYVVGGYALGKWLSVQRRTWESLSEERRQRLQQLPGWTLDARGEWWEEGFGHLQRYVEEHGNARVPQTCVFDGFNLGLWVANQRGRWDTLGDERRQRLQSLPGWTLDAEAAFWEEGFHHLQRYAEENGHTKVPQKYIVDGFKLGVWINTQRVIGQSSTKNGSSACRNFQAGPTTLVLPSGRKDSIILLRYIAENGDALVPTTVSLRDSGWVSGSLFNAATGSH